MISWIALGPAVGQRYWFELGPVVTSLPPSKLITFVMVNVKLFEPDPIAVNSSVLVAFRVRVVEPALTPIWISKAGIVPWQNS